MTDPVLNQIELAPPLFGLIASKIRLADTKFTFHFRKPNAAMVDRVKKQIEEQCKDVINLRKHDKSSTAGNMLSHLLGKISDLDTHVRSMVVVYHKVDYTWDCLTGQGTQKIGEADSAGFDVVVDCKTQDDFLSDEFLQDAGETFKEKAREWPAPPQFYPPSGVKEEASDFIEDAGEFLEDAGETLKEEASNVKEEASDFIIEDAGDFIGDAEDKIKEILPEGCEDTLGGGVSGWEGQKYHTYKILISLETVEKPKKINCSTRGGRVLQLAAGGNEAFCLCKQQYTGEDCADEIVYNDNLNSTELEIWTKNQDVPGMQAFLEEVRKTDKEIRAKLINAADAIEVAANKVTGEIQSASVTIAEGLKIDLTQVSLIKKFGFRLTTSFRASLK